MPSVVCFKPQGVPLAQLETVILTLDELEALKLADLEGLYQSKAADAMGVSRQTFGRILESAHRKVADALAQGKSIVFEGGVVMRKVEEKELCVCSQCGYEAEHRQGIPCRSMKCPECGSGMTRKGGCGEGKRRTWKRSAGSR